LQVESGLFNRRLHNLELWRVQDISLERTLLNRMTRDGTLVFHIIHEKRPLKVTGFARGKDLEEAYRKLLNLSFLLRTSSAVKGVIS
jgi:hypothetical protein